MYIFLTILLILASCYVGSSTMKEENKTGYFVVIGIIVLLIILFGIVFTGGSK